MYIKCVYVAAEHKDPYRLFINYIALHYIVLY